MLDPHRSEEILAPILAEGVLGDPLALVRPPSAAGPDRAGTPLPSVFVRRSLAGTSADALADDLGGGAAGLIVSGFDDPGEIERLSARLAVAEASAGRADGTTALLVLIESAALVARLPLRADRRLTGLGLDPVAVGTSIGLPAGLADGAALDAARGMTVLAAAAAGVPAFQRLPATAGPSDLMAARIDGFAWALIALADP